MAVWGGRPRGLPARRVRLSSGWRYSVVTALLFLLAMVLAARLEQVAERNLAGSATVNDGDTVTLAGERIRLRGIDAPELEQICRAGGGEYFCGREARRALIDLVAGRAISCSGWERDRYRRLLAICRAGDIELNAALVERGWAVSYGDYADLERTAQRRGVGLWAGEFDRPGEWRQRYGDAGEMAHDLRGLLLNWLRQVFSPA
jgi:endonuclease YncB( thermonuclease family)